MTNLGAFVKDKILNWLNFLSRIAVNLVITKPTLQRGSLGICEFHPANRLEMQLAG